MKNRSCSHRLAGEGRTGQPGTSRRLHRGRRSKGLGLLEKYPEIDVRKNKFGVYAKLAKADAVLRDKDRVEIYRPPSSPTRRKSASSGRLEGKVMKKGAGDDAAGGVSCRKRRWRAQLATCRGR